MSKIDIVMKGITDMEVDAVVNAANSGLRAGSGVCGAIFKNAGMRDMQAACDAIGHCDEGNAVITPGFALKAKYVIHTVGPRWAEGGYGKAEILASCYTESIDLAVENGCKSIAFPLISSGIYGWPKEEAWRVAIQACLDKLAELGERGPSVTFCVLSDSSFEQGQNILAELTV
jgi:O-acetyl-ADP-ribose deacetylase (regulator of RNase III)